MRVYIELGAPGARLAGERGDVLVLLDALRASTTIICALVVGASRVIPVLAIEEALRLRHNQGFLVAGERGGAKIAGFDFGNSPAEMLQHGSRLNGQALVLTTSNGTRCVQAAFRAGATAILAGALPNAAAVVQAAWTVADRANRDITLLAAGQNDGMSDEDWFSASWLLQSLVSDFGATGVVTAMDRVAREQSVQTFAASEAGQRLSELGYVADVFLCAQFDTLQLVPIYQAEVGFVAMSSYPEVTCPTCTSRGGTGNGR